MDKNNSLKAINKNVRTSPRKLAVCNFIKGKKADVRSEI